MNILDTVDFNTVKAKLSDYPITAPSLKKVRKLALKEVKKIEKALLVYGVDVNAEKDE